MKEMRESPRWVDIFTGYCHDKAVFYFLNLNMKISGKTEIKKYIWFDKFDRIGLKCWDWREIRRVVGCTFIT